MSEYLDSLQWNADGLMPAIAQDAEDGTILMMAWMNREALSRTQETGEAVYWSRSRQKLWHKGEKSGHTQTVTEIRTDCDSDVILLCVQQKGGISCHTGRRHCFYRKLEDGQWQSVEPILKPSKEIYR